MRHARRAIRTAGVLVALLLAAPASAQSVLNGDWVGLFHEDQPERGPGPELGDYLGLPLNAAARQYAESWDASRLTLPEHQCRAHVSPYIYRGPVRVRISEERDPETQARRRRQALHEHLRAGAHDLAGWTATSLRTRAAHLDGILDRGVAGQCPQGAHHAPEAGLAPPQRRADERPRDDDGVLLPPRQRC